MSSSYWARRAAEQMETAQRGAHAALVDIRHANVRAQTDIQRNIQRIKQNYVRRFRISKEEAAQYLAEPCGREAYLEILAQIKNMPASVQRRRLEAKANSGAYAYRISREEAQRDLVHAATVRMAYEEQQTLELLLGDTLREQASRSTYNIQRRTGIGYEWAGVDADIVRRAIYKPWSGKSFSARIWQSQEALEETLNEILPAGLLTGRSYYKMAQDVSERMNVSMSRAKTLVHTEGTHATAQGDIIALDEAELDWYSFLSTLDMVTSKACQALDGKVFRRKEAQTGKNLPPMHPNCRSCIVAVIDGQDISRLERIARDPVTGEAVKVPRNMSYPEWLKLQEETYGKDRIDAARKIVQNKAADKKQYGDYKKVLGKTPYTKTFKEFQQAKYLDVEAYKFMKLDYRRRDALIKDASLALPNAKTATAADAKFAKYLFNPDSRDGWPKGVAIDSRLGYNINNWEQMRTEIIKSASTYPATIKNNDKYGTGYTQKIVLYGLKGKPANVEVGWKSKGDDLWMATAMIKEVKDWKNQ